MLKGLATKDIVSIAKKFIMYEGYACRLDISKEKKDYLLRNKLIIENKDTLGWYFLTKQFYIKFKNILKTSGFTWVELELLKDFSPLKVIFFDTEIMHLFLNNPNYHFIWNGYSGYVYSDEHSKLDVYVKDICMCHDLEENRVVFGIFITDLLKCSKISQIIMQPYVLENDYRRYEFHYCNYKNLFLGQWLDYEEIDIYNILLEGIKIINFIFNKKYKLKLYKNEYSLEELQFFMPLFFPTKINRFNFMMELSKIFLDNIDIKTLKKLIKDNYENMSNKGEFSLDDLKDSNFREFKAFKTYFKQYELFNEKSFAKLDEIRGLRTEPAHKIYLNDLNYEYCIEQDMLLKNVYRIIFNIIYVEDPNYDILNEYENGNYNSFYGKGGSISLYNGFNASNYQYFNGYIRLINEKFKIRDAEILIAGKDKTKIKEVLLKYITTNIKVDKSEMELILDFMLSDIICAPSKKELESFFYGKSFIKMCYGEIEDYKLEGKKLYEKFRKNNYKYVYVIADSTDLMCNVNQIMQFIKVNMKTIYGSGLFINALTNNFSDDDSNVFISNFNEEIYIDSNVWD